MGELNVSLSYLPSMDRLKVVILRAKNFRRLEFDDTGKKLTARIYFAMGNVCGVFDIAVLLNDREYFP